MTPHAVIYVPGIPQTKGSTKGFIRKGRVQITNDNTKERPWHIDVATLAKSKWGATPRIEGPVSIEVDFLLVKPKRPQSWWHLTKPDVDKILRSICDALKTAGIYRDDSQIVHTRASKWYAGNTPGVRIEVKQLERTAAAELIYKALLANMELVWSRHEGKGVRVEIAEVGR